MPVTRRLLQIGIAVGLVCVGLLTGILFMLWTSPSASELADEDDAPRPRIELGDNSAPSYGHTPSEADTGATPASMPELATLNEAFRTVAERVTPAVVFIQIETGRSGNERSFQFDGNEMDRFMPRPQRSVGSGVILNSEGYIVTNEHVVAGARTINVTLHDKRQYEATIVGSDPSTDLAVLKVEEEGAPFPTVSLGNSDALRVGDWVVAVGNPFRLTSTVTAGIVSALGRQVDIIDDTFSIEDFIQTDAAINPGNSGGALVNLEGDLVGINTAIATESGASEGYGFAVPVQLMQRVVTDLIEYGEVQRGYLGVSIEEVDAPRARRLNMDDIRGVYIGTVRPGGAAARGGIEDGDVVLSIDGREINAPNTLQSAVAQRRPGDTMQIRVWRSGRIETKEIELMGRETLAYQEWVDELEGGDPQDTLPAPPNGPDADPPEDDEAPTLDLPDWGLGLRPLVESHKRAFGIDRGAYVAFVENGGPADRAGMPRDVVLTHIEDQSVTDAEDVVQQLNDTTADRVLVRVHRRDGTGAFYDISTP